MVESQENLTDSVNNQIVHIAEALPKVNYETKRGVVSIGGLPDHGADSKLLRTSMIDRNTERQTQ